MKLASILFTEGSVQLDLSKDLIIKDSLGLEGAHLIQKVKDDSNKLGPLLKPNSSNGGSV